MVTNKSTTHRRLLFAGVALTAAGPVLILLCTVGGMLRSFQMIQAEAAPTPAMLAKPVEFTVIASYLGAAIGVIGLALIAVAIILRPRAHGSDLHKTGVVA